MDELNDGEGMEVQGLYTREVGRYTLGLSPPCPGVVDAWGNGPLHPSPAGDNIVGRFAVLVSLVALVRLTHLHHGERTRGWIHPSRYPLPHIMYRSGLPSARRDRTQRGREEMTTFSRGGAGHAASSGPGIILG